MAGQFGGDNNLPWMFHPHDGGSQTTFEFPIPSKAKIPHEFKDDEIPDIFLDLIGALLMGPDMLAPPGLKPILSPQAIHHGRARRPLALPEPKKPVGHRAEPKAAQHSPERMKEAREVTDDIFGSMLGNAEAEAWKALEEVQPHDATKKEESSVTTTATTTAVPKPLQPAQVPPAAKAALKDEKPLVVPKKDAQPFWRLTGADLKTGDAAGASSIEIVVPEGVRIGEPKEKKVPVFNVGANASTDLSREPDRFLELPVSVGDGSRCTRTGRNLKCQLEAEVVQDVPIHVLDEL
jgi:hypothetical protein